MLNETQAALFGDRVPEELHDLQNDTNETINLAWNGNYRDDLLIMRNAQDGWIEDTGAMGPQKESWNRYLRSYEGRQLID